MPAAELNELKEDVENETQKPQDPHRTHREELNIFDAAQDENRTDDAEPKGCGAPALAQVFRDRILHPVSPEPNTKRQNDECNAHPEENLHAVICIRPDHRTWPKPVGEDLHHARRIDGPQKSHKSESYKSQVKEVNL